MAKTIRLPADEPLLNIVSYGRGGPKGDIRLSAGELEHIRRTVQRTPEVMVKVLSRGSNNLEAAGKHIDYISRKGELELETDDSTSLEHVSGTTLLEEWDLDIDEVRRQPTFSAANGREPPKLVHKLMFSMPPGTPPEKVLGAVRNFAREEFWGQHRYALALHTDEAHPHVHLVLKAVSEQGVRLNIKKAMLRHWRSEFARHLRVLGVAANATERAVRGQSKKGKKDGIYRAGLRGHSTFVRAQAEQIASELLKTKARTMDEPGKRTLAETRKQVETGWRYLSEALAQRGELDLATQVRHFVEAMPPARTDWEVLASALLEKMRPRQIERHHT